MEIVLKKINPSNHTLSISKKGKIFEQVSLDTKTYFLHDITHYCVEKELKLKDGFWGMIDQGYKMEQLSGKNNELTDELRRVEQIVGPTQSVFSGYMSVEMFRENMQLINFTSANPHFIENVIEKIEVIMNQWKYLAIGQTLELEFTI